MSDAHRDAPGTAAEALLRARHHTERAMREAILAARAITDAASLATLGVPADEGSALGGVVRAIEDVARALDDGRAASPLFEALHNALDSEIGRWERRAETDRDARAVLRAFLSVREVLWELGVRRRDPSQRNAAAPPPPAPRATNPRPAPEPANERPPRSAEAQSPHSDGPGDNTPRRRVQRIPIDG